MSSSRSLSQNKPKTPSKLSKSVTARSKSNSSSSRSSPPPPPPLPPPPSFTSMKPKHPKEKESYISTGPRSIFSYHENEIGFLEFIDSQHGLVQISMILDNGKIKTFKVVKNKLIITDEKFLGQTVESVRENNIKMLKKLGIKDHPQYKGKYGGKKTRKHRKTKGKKYYKKRTLSKRK